MKSLVVFYSRTGVTQRIAETIAKALDSDLEEIIDTKNREGIIGYLKSGRDAVLKKLTKIESLKHDISKYDLIIIGTPVWAFTVSTPIRTFLSQYKDYLKKVVFFCTMGGSGSKNAFKEMYKLCKNRPIASLQLKTKEVVKGTYQQKLNNFINIMKLNLKSYL